MCPFIFPKDSKKNPKFFAPPPSRRVQYFLPTLRVEEGGRAQRGRASSVGKMPAEEGGLAHMREGEHRGGRTSTEEGGRQHSWEDEHRGGRTSTEEGGRQHIWEDDHRGGWTSTEGG